MASTVASEVSLMALFLLFVTFYSIFISAAMGFRDFEIQIPIPWILGFSGFFRDFF